MVRPTVIRTKSKDRNARYAKGKNAIGICHRSGFKVPYKELRFERGTNYLVHRSENDEDWSLVAHPQNFPPEDKIERIALKWSFPDVALSIGTIVSLRPFQFTCWCIYRIYVYRLERFISSSSC